MDAYILRPWRRIVDFSGRSTRREFWLFQLQMPIVVLLVMMFGSLLGLEGTTGRILLGILALGLIPWFIASLAISVRRLHDHDKSGWFLLLGIIPWIGGLIQLIMMLWPGDNGENSYGYDPRDGDQPAAEDMAQVFS
jgi:uncharacterized membrane protein YhaH (DUF805 family)